VTSLEDAEKLFSIGIEKISLNSTAFKNPELISKLAAKYGNQSVVVSVNINKDFWGKRHIVTNSMEKIPMKTDSISSEMKAFEELGAGEILINDVNRDGTMKGYDVELISSITSKVDVPVIACGGCGSYGDIKDVIFNGGAGAAAAGSIFVFNGPRKAVLISYPDRLTIKKIINE
jgi:cyclase